MKIKFDMIGLFVSDISEMVNFYKNVIGMEIEWDGNGPYAEFKHDGIRFSMYERRKLENLLGQKPSFPEGINGTFELSIDVGTPDQVDKFFNKIINLGGKPIYKPRNEPWNMRSAMVADPEGNLIEIGANIK